MKIIKGAMKLIMFPLIDKGCIMLEIPKTNSMFAMLEPSTFPMAISLYPLSADFIVTVSSGMDVPIATKVIPIIVVGKPKNSAK